MSEWLGYVWQYDCSRHECPAQAREIPIGKGDYTPAGSSREHSTQTKLYVNASAIFMICVARQCLKWERDYWLNSSHCWSTKIFLHSLKKTGFATG